MSELLTNLIVLLVPPYVVGSLLMISLLILALASFKEPEELRVDDRSSEGISGDIDQLARLAVSEEEEIEQVRESWAKLSAEDPKPITRDQIMEAKNVLEKHGLRPIGEESMTVLEQIQGEEDFEAACRIVFRAMFTERVDFEELAEIGEWMLEYYDDQSPMSMGWVGSDGLP